jgi:hypothetical protein
MKKWCKHITHGSGTSWWIDLLKSTTDKIVLVPENWKVCPICQSERPTKANIAAAILPSLMDSDQ